LPEKTAQNCEFFRDAQTDALVLAITGNAGSGKTATKKYEPKTKMFRLSCNEYWDRKWFCVNCFLKWVKKLTE
jgi:hypothetical protein